MQTHVTALAEQAKEQQPKVGRQSAQLVGQPQAMFVDKRPRTVAQRQLQTLTNSSPQVAEGKALQAMMNNSAWAHMPQSAMPTAPLQRVAGGKPLQAKFATARSVEEEKPLQAKLATEGLSQLIEQAAPGPNNTGLPNQLKTGIESLSGMSMDHVKVNYNSDKPAQLNAHAYAQGSEIHLAAGQEHHLPHEAWHVVQQAQGRVKPTMQMKAGVPVNDDAGLEAEADAMGAKANTLQLHLKKDLARYTPTNLNATAQLAPAALVGFVTGPSKFTGLGMMFDSWGKLETAIESYAVLASDNISKRHELLANMTNLSMAWLNEYKQRASLNTPDAKDGSRKALFDQLDPILTLEEKEVTATSGKLADVGAGKKVSPDPRLTKELKADDDAKDAPGGGMFKVDADIKDAMLLSIDRGTQGKVCKILQGWQEAQKVGSIAAEKGNYHKVEAESADLAAKNFQAIKTGFVSKDNLLEVNRVEPALGLKYKSKASHLEHPLFAHPPVIADVVQVGLGDCYLLAAMMSVLNTDPGHFADHMRDNKNGTVTVKLYKNVGDAVLITLQKSVVVQDKFFEKDQTDAFASGALWVRLYEKAYVAAGFYGSGLETLPSAQASYGMIEGGYGHVAQIHITGVAAEDHKIETGRGDIQAKFNSYIKSPELMVNFGKLGDPSAYPLGDKDLQYIEDLAQFGILNSISVKLDELLTKTFVTTADLIKMLTEEGVKKSYIDIIMGKVEAEKLMTGPLGAGKYSQGELNLFKSITDKFDAGKKMTIGSRKDIFDSADEVLEKGGSAGESMVKGLVGPHAYAILDYAPKPVVEGKALSVKLRNPWSSYGRKYKKPDELAPVKNETGDTFAGAERVEDRTKSGAESWFDLADIAAYFTSFSSM